MCLCVCIRFYTEVTQGNETLHSTVKEPCRDNDMWLLIWKATRLIDEVEKCYCCVDQCAVFWLDDGIPVGLLDPVSWRKMRWTIANARIIKGRMKWKAKKRVNHGGREDRNEGVLPGEDRKSVV